MRERMLTCSILIFAVVSSVRAADDAGDAKAIIEKGVQALGGEQNLSKFKAATFKSKGKFGDQQAIEFTADVSVQPPKQSKRVVKFDISGMLITRIEAVNGDKGWFRAMGRIQDMNPTMLA